ncbi:MAG: hypothetical protein ACXU7H_11825 [Burkholderiaceae bacterium]
MQDRGAHASERDTMLPQRHASHIGEFGERSTISIEDLQDLY